jgi:glycosyltransferase involved in cell wall biosynthesis
MKGNTWAEFMANILVNNNIDIKRVFTLPITPNDKLRELYSKTDIGLFPNRCEGGTNLVLMEYMACGKPVIASYNSGHKDILTENNSILLKEMKKYELFSDEQLVADWEEPLLEEIINAIEFAYHNKNKLQDTGKTAGEDLKKLTWEKTADSLLSQIK